MELDDRERELQAAVDLVTGLQEKNVEAFRVICERITEIERQMLILAKISHVHEGQTSAPPFPVPPKASAN